MWGRCMEVGLLKENSERFHESISKNLFDYMELTNHFILVKLSLMIHDDKVYNTEIDTCVSLNNLALNSVDLGNFLKCYHDKNIIFWTFLDEGQTDSLFVNHDVKVTHQNVGDFVYLQLSKEDDNVNLQHTFNRDFSFIEHLSTNKQWTRDYLSKKINFPKFINKKDDIKSNDNCPDFVIKDIEMDSGQGIYLFDKDDYLDSMESLYCEEYIDTNKYLNTYHLVGKEKSFDVTNYEKLNYIDAPKYQLLDQKEDIFNRLGVQLRSRYISRYDESNEYK